MGNLYQGHFISSGGSRRSLYGRKVPRMDRRCSFKGGFRNFYLLINAELLNLMAFRGSYLIVTNLNLSECWRNIPVC
jgi:hypothetical protein